ncbi:putative protein OS=Streptomyces glaucescens OX=1907 GN=SGLAU_17985 PE=4 SV=1 [Streptomyces glaucescens]
MVDDDPPVVMPTERIVSAWTLPVQLLAAATAEAPGATKLVPGQRTTAALRPPPAPADIHRPHHAPERPHRTSRTCSVRPPPGPRPTTTPDAPPPRKPARRAPTPNCRPLEAGFYLDEDIAIGTLAVLGPLLADHAPTDPAP